MNPQKRIAILFLVLISFQIGGYYGITEFLKRQLSEKTARKIQAEKAPIGGQLVLKIPVNSSARLDAYSNGKRHFSFEGKVYQVIDRHTYDDILYVVCIHDDRATDAQATIESLVQSFAGKSGETADGTKLIENLTKYFWTEEYAWCTAANGWSSDISFGGQNDHYEYHGEKFLFHPPSC